jgi:hypothetical protein
MITASLTLLSSSVTAIWEHGEIAGDPGAVAYLHALAEIREGREIGLAGQGTSTTTNHLSSAQSFIALCELASDTYPTVTIEGDEPELEPANLPEGTVA